MMKCKKIHEFHKILNVKAKKYSDIFKNMSAEKSSDWIKSYVIYVLILHVCKDTFDKEQTVLIATYTDLKIVWWCLIKGSFNYF